MHEDCLIVDWRAVPQRLLVFIERHLAAPLAPLVFVPAAGKIPLEQLHHAQVPVGLSILPIDGHGLLKRAGSPGEVGQPSIDVPQVVLCDGAAGFEPHGPLEPRFRLVETFLRFQQAAEVDARLNCLPRDEAFKIPDLIRTKINLLPEGIPEVRTVEITGLDLQADGGTHVANTREVGRIRITDYKSKGGINKRIYIELDE